MVSFADHLWGVKETIASHGRLPGHYTHGTERVTLYQKYHKSARNESVHDTYSLKLGCTVVKIFSRIRKNSRFRMYSPSTASNPGVVV